MNGPLTAPPGPARRPLTMADVISVPRTRRRLMMKDEERRRKSGDWGRWTHIPLPFGPHNATGGWPRDIRAAWKNAVFAVLERPVAGARHLAVSSLSGIRPTFHEMQRIKNDLAGADATAIEIYPPQAELVDEAEMFHLWVLPGPLPFTIFEGRDG